MIKCDAAMPLERAGRTIMQNKHSSTKTVTRGGVLNSDILVHQTIKCTNMPSNDLKPTEERVHSFFFLFFVGVIPSTHPSILSIREACVFQQNKKRDTHRKRDGSNNGSVEKMGQTALRIHQQNKTESVLLASTLQPITVVTCVALRLRASW